MAEKLVHGASSEDEGSVFVGDPPHELIETHKAALNLDREPRR